MVTTRCLNPLFLMIFLCAQASHDSRFKLRINCWDRAKEIDSTQLPLSSQKEASLETVTDCLLQTNSGIKIPTTFHDRESDVVLIAAQGLPATKESMKIFTELFPCYDTMLFDYRWSGKYGSFLAQSILSTNPVQKVLLDEVEELTTVVDYAVNKKNYKAVVGLGECYSCFHLAKVQSDRIKSYGKGPFTHLIFDSCWHSLRSFGEQICSDPCLPIKPQSGGAPRIIKLITDSFLFKKVALAAVFSLMSDVSLEPYISTVNIPVLFIHGSNDLFVPQNDFGKVWEKTNNEKRALLLTAFRHCGNLKNKDMYRFISEKFISCNETKQFSSDLEKLTTLF